MRTFCPHCNASGNVPDQALGRGATCKSCGQRFIIQSADISVQPSPPPTDDWNALSTHNEGHVGEYVRRHRKRRLAWLIALCIAGIGGAWWLFSGPGGPKLGGYLVSNEQLVVDYLKKNLDDPTDFEVVEWGKPEHVQVAPTINRSNIAGLEGIVDEEGNLVEEKKKKKEPPRPWQSATFIDLRFRSRNRIGARMVFHHVFLIKDNEVVGDRVVSSEYPFETALNIAQTNILSDAELDIKTKDD